MTAALFSAGRFRALPLDGPDVRGLQRFLETNPEYTLAVEGRPPPPDAAAGEFEELPPAGMPYRARWLLRLLDERVDGDAWAGMADGLHDFLAPGVAHIGLFIVATALHGSGAAHALYRGLEGWLVQQGAQWIRLGVVAGNARAERFWERSGYVEVRRREGLVMGLRTHTVRVMVKAPAGRPLDEYLGLVARDRPGAP